MPDTNLDILNLLITRVLDGCATPEDWRRLDALGAQNADVWRELAQAQRADQSLRRAVSEVVDRAGVHELSESHLHAGAVSRGQRTFEARSRGVATWGGWAAAATIAFAFFSQRAWNTPPASSGTQGASLLEVGGEDPLQQYIDAGRKQGRVYGELPEKVLVQTVPAPDGQGYDVVYIRQIVERTRVPDLYQMHVSSDELGQPVPKPVRIAPARAW